MSEHFDGTYAGIYLSDESKLQLESWAKKHNIHNLINSDEFHCTIVYSRVGVPKLENEWFDLGQIPIITPIRSWHVFNTQNFKRCLVGILDSYEIRDLHEDLHYHYPDLTYDYDNFLPHLTLSYDFTTLGLPTEVPDFRLVFNRQKIQGLDKTYGQ